MNKCPGVDISTDSLGQGIAVANGMAQSGPYDKLLEINGITKEDIVKTAKKLLETC